MNIKFLYMYRLVQSSGTPVHFYTFGCSINKLHKKIISLFIFVHKKVMQEFKKLA